MLPLADLQPGRQRRAAAGRGTPSWWCRSGDGQPPSTTQWSGQRAACHREVGSMEACRPLGPTTRPMSPAEERVMDDVVVGVDAHRRTHTLVAVDQLGRKLAQKTIGTDGQSHTEAMRWVRARFGTAVVWGVEDCRSLTARLERDLLAAGQKVIRVPPHLMSRSRASSRELGKSDPIDALAVARAVQREPDLTGRLPRPAVDAVAATGGPTRGPRPAPRRDDQPATEPRPST